MHTRVGHSEFGYTPYFCCTFVYTSEIICSLFANEPYECCTIDT